MVSFLKGISHSRWYWITGIVGSLFMVATALVYQHAFDEQPCVLCIQMRLWFVLLAIVSLLGLFFSGCSRSINSIFHGLVVFIAIGLTERSYQLLGTERGFVFGDCTFDLGMPSWFAVDQWFPWLFRVETSCGYTPYIVFQISMAEALIVISSVLLLLSIAVSLVSLMKIR